MEKERVLVENSNKPHGNGTIDPNNFSPFPKNPTIAKFFKEIGRVDELGSGVRNTYKYSKIYSGGEPVFIESDVFKTIIPLKYISNQNSDQVSDQDERTEKLLEFCKIPKSRSEIQEFMNIKSRRYLRNNILRPLIDGGQLELTIPDKPTSPKQKYYTNN
ncbi:Fic family protein [Piscibacillus sp. B03]|uniref:Fic family protein n=1 Tax=Piscibacillus sp. B03 TaxID=3457430 RepID=UPI003FCC51DD